LIGLPVRLGAEDFGGEVIRGERFIGGGRRGREGKSYGNEENNGNNGDDGVMGIVGIMARRRINGSANSSLRVSLVSPGG